MSGRILLASTLFVCAALAARADDVLDRFAKENQLKSQKLVLEAKDALYEARLLETKNPKAARDLLQGILTRLEGADLAKDQQSIVRDVRSQVDRLGRYLRDQQAADQKIINQAVRDKELRQANQPKTPGKDSVTVFADRFIGSGKNALDTHNRIREMQSKGIIDLRNDINITYANSFKENRVPERYLWALENRHNDKLSKAEKAILKALNSVLSVDWDNVRFKDAIEHIQDKASINVLLHENSLKEADVTYDDKVSLKVKKVTVRTILKKILNERGLSYIIKDGNLHVLTIQQARETMVTRIYPVADLVSPDPRFGLFMGQQMMLQNVQSLIQLIQNTIDPPIWQNGATIQFFQPTMSLVVRAPAELHLQMGFGSGKR